MCLYTYTNHLRWNKAPGTGIWVGLNNNPDFVNSELAPVTELKGRALTAPSTEDRNSSLGSYKAEVACSPEPSRWLYLVHLLHHHSCPKNICWENNGTSACKLTGSWEFALVLQIWDQYVQHIKYWSLLVLVAILASQWHLLGKRRKI